MILSILLAGALRLSLVPGRHWDPATREEMHLWSRKGLDDVKTYAGFIDTSALMIVWRGHVVLQVGDLAHKFMVHSMRKSLLNSLIGIAVGNKTIDIKSTIGQLGIDDQPAPLSAEEKQATVEDLLEARSGVYHPAALETPDMAPNRPARGSHVPGTFWFYNNWDFNVLGSIYQTQTGMKIYEAFRDQIAHPLGMEDFKAEDGEYASGPESLHPGYPARLSTRDLARFGLLYLRDGLWDGKRILPSEWVASSTRSYSDAGPIGGYGRLWWVVTKPKIGPFAGVPEGSYFAWGYRGHYVVVIPSLDLVVVHRVDTDQDEREVTHAEFGRLLRMIVRSAPSAPGAARAAQ